MESQFVKTPDNSRSAKDIMHSQTNNQSTGKPHTNMNLQDTTTTTYGKA